MDISKRLLRRPAATASWLALLLLAALLVQLGFGLIYAAHVLAQKVEALSIPPSRFPPTTSGETAAPLSTRCLPTSRCPAWPRPTVCCKWICGALPPERHGGSLFL